MKPHIDDEIFRVHEFIQELSKVQDNYYKELEKKFLEDPLYSLEKVKETLDEVAIGYSSDLINNEEQLKEFFWDYMYNDSECRDFIDHMIEVQKNRNEYLKEHIEEHMGD